MCPLVGTALSNLPGAQNVSPNGALACHLDAASQWARRVIAWDYFGPLPLTESGNKYILLLTDRFSRHAVMYAVSESNDTAEGTANILV